MVPKIHASGGSFRGVMAYCLGDKRIEKPEVDDDPSRDPAERERLQREWKEWQRQQAERPQYWAGEVSKRVAWTETLNLDTDKPRQAARRMAATASYSQELKRQAGIPAGGRRLEKPVCHYTLNWKEGETPARREMVKAVNESLEALGMADRQAVVVSHKDGKCAHVHVVVNRVSWEDGRAAKLSRSRAALSKWSERWEKERGEVQCKRRVEHNRIRATGKAVYDRESRRRDAIYRRGPRFEEIKRETVPDGRTEDEARRVAERREREQQTAAYTRKLVDRTAELVESDQRREWKELYERQAQQRRELTGGAPAGASQQTARALSGEISMSEEERALGQAVGEAISKRIDRAGSGGVITARKLARIHCNERREMRRKHNQESRACQKVLQDAYDQDLRQGKEERGLPQERTAAPEPGPDTVEKLLRERERIWKLEDAGRGAENQAQLYREATQAENALWNRVCKLPWSERNEYERREAVLERQQGRSRGMSR